MDGEARVRSVLPTQGHLGLSYKEFMAQISAKRQTNLYLEIGVSAGFLFSAIHSRIAVGVDPEFKINTNIAANKSQIILHQTTSDAFFANKQITASLPGTLNLTFLDGLHNFEFLLRDFYNAEAYCTSNSLIVMHDCLPLNAAMAARDVAVARKLMQGTPFADFWTGDVWKIIPILLKYRPDLRLLFIDCPPTGLVCATKLDSKSRVLQDNYGDIVEEFALLPNDFAQISQLYETIEISRSSAILRRDEL